MSRFFGAVVILALLLGVAHAGEVPHARVSTGELSGVRQVDVAAFLGVPFAAPPVGDLRWRAPRPPLAWAGILLLCGGVLCQVSIRRAPATAALLNAGVIALYTILDGIGVRASGQIFAYSLWIFLLGALPLLLWNARQGSAFFLYAVRRAPQALAGGAGTVAAYSLVLWAMTQAPVAVVAALRETAILFGAAISGLVLKEKIGWNRLAAALMVTMGAILLRLA